MSLIQEDAKFKIKSTGKIKIVDLRFVFQSLFACWRKVSLLAQIIEYVLRRVIPVRISWVQQYTEVHLIVLPALEECSLWKLWKNVTEFANCVFYVAQQSVAVVRASLLLMFVFIIVALSSTCSPWKTVHFLGGCVLFGFTVPMQMFSHGKLVSHSPRQSQ